MTDNLRSLLVKKALAVLARREESRVGLARKLAAYCDDEGLINSVLDELAENNWQSDSRYAEIYIRSKSQTHGNRYLQRALAENGIDSDEISVSMPDDGEQLENAIAVLRKKYRGPPADWNAGGKYLNFLHYRGFPGDIARAALKAAWTTGSAGEEEDFF